MSAPSTIASDTLVEAIAVAILNSDRIAGGWPPVESRDDIPDSDGYVRNATAALTAITEAGFVIVPAQHPTFKAPPPIDGEHHNAYLMRVIHSFEDWANSRRATHNGKAE